MRLRWRYGLSIIGLGILCFCAFGVVIWRQTLKEFATPILSAPIPFTTAMPVLTDKEVLDLQEVDRLEAAVPSNTVVAISVPVGRNDLLAAYANGQVIRWDLANRAPSGEYNGILTPDETVSFDPGGRYVSSSVCIYDLASNTWLGPQQPCDPTAYRIGSATAFLWPRDNVLSYSPGVQFVSRSCVSAACNWTGSYALGSIDDPDGILTVGRVVSDRSSDHIAVAFEQGITRVYKLGDDAKISNFVAEIGVRQRDDGHAPAILAMDDTQSRIALAIGDQLEVWRIAATVREPLFVAGVSDVRAMAFDQSGRILLVGTATSLQVWDMATQLVIREYAASGLSSLTLSPDGRMVVWGDERGTIHLWAAPY